jgi:hypothetical protein
VAPTKATVFPLVQKEALNEQAAKISAALTAAGLSNIIDTTGEAHALLLRAAVMMCYVRFCSCGSKLIAIAAAGLMATLLTPQVRHPRAAVTCCCYDVLRAVFSCGS